MHCHLSTVVHYTRRDGRTASAYFAREVALPFRPAVGDYLDLDADVRGFPPAPNFRVEHVSWEVES